LRLETTFGVIRKFLFICVYPAVVLLRRGKLCSSVVKISAHESRHSGCRQSCATRRPRKCVRPLR
jgi:hypothetical protein